MILILTSLLILFVYRILVLVGDSFGIHFTFFLRGKLQIRLAVPDFTNFEKVITIMIITYYQF